MVNDMENTESKESAENKENPKKKKHSSVLAVLLIIFFGSQLIEPLIVVLCMFTFSSCSSFNHYDRFAGELDKLPSVSNAAGFHVMDKTLAFGNRVLKLKDLVTEGELCDGVELCGDRIYFSVREKSNDIYTFRIMRCGLYGENVTTVFSKQYSFPVCSSSRERVIYISREKHEDDVVPVDVFYTETETYRHEIWENADCTTYVKELENQRKYRFDYKLTSSDPMKVTDRETGQIKTVTTERLAQDPIGKLIIKESQWGWNGADVLDGKIFLTCTVLVRDEGWFDYTYLNVVYEYDFDSDTLLFRFYFDSYDWVDYIYLRLGSAL